MSQHIDDEPPERDHDPAEGLAHNQRKLQVLALLAARGDLGNHEIAEEVEITHSNARMVLSRCMKGGYVESDGGSFTPGVGSTAATYRLTEHGYSRLKYEREGESDS